MIARPEPLSRIRRAAPAEPTVRRYLDLLSGALMVRQLPPWHENLAKRLGAARGVAMFEKCAPVVGVPPLGGRLPLVGVRFGPVGHGGVTNTPGESAPRATRTPTPTLTPAPLEDAAGVPAPIR